MEERLQNALIKGNSDTLEADLKEALTVYPSAVAIIEGPLMAGMQHVGRLFGEGRMFLPQVVKTARTMKQAVDFIVESGQMNQRSLAEGKSKIESLPDGVFRQTSDKSVAYINGVSEEIFKVGFCLPAGPYVTDEDVRYIVECIKEAVGY